MIQTKAFKKVAPFAYDFPYHSSPDATTQGLVQPFVACGKLFITFTLDIFERTGLLR